MQSTKKNILFIAGLGSTGSSAMCDILKEYDGIVCPDEEWRIWTDPDGLLDFFQNINSGTTLFQHNIAVKRFSKLIKNLTSSKFGPYSTLNLPAWIKSSYRDIHNYLLTALKAEEYSGLWYGNTNKLFAKLNFRPARIFWKNKFINKKMYILSNFLDSNLATRAGEKFIDLLFKNINDDSCRCLAINENFSILRAEEIFKLHPESKIILVIRDPLDVYADSYRVGWLAMPYDIEKFIIWQNFMYDQVQNIYRKFQNQIHIVRFEDLCNNYDAELERLSAFIPEIMEKKTHEFFFPNKSSKNIGQWKKTTNWISSYKESFHYHTK